jgi:alkylation response protein AidB-like acyl-CoA dehydrogenase
MAQNEVSEQELRERTRALVKEVNPDEVDRATFRGAQYDRGLAWVHFPEGYGGLGLSPKMQQVVNGELRERCKTVYSDMALNPIGIGMGAPTVLTHGTEWMKDNLLKRIFTGEDIWCQLFSEPGAGSDVAGLSTRAVRDGDDWILNGQKVWITLAHVSNWGMLLARTDPDVAKHDGLSYFLLDMHAPGVEVRPLYQITGEAEFNEVFLNDVRISNDRLFGKVGQGWQVAITTLMNERMAIGAAEGPRSGPAAPLVELWKGVDKSRFSAAQQALLRDRVAELHIRSELLGITGQRAKASMRAGTPGPEGSVSKLAQAELNKAIWECAMDVLGADALTFEAGYERRQGAGWGRSADALAKYQFLRSRANSIEGGTSEIMRNILGERVLGLPGEPRVDKNVPWKDVPRS